MVSFRDIIIFLAGAEFFHTLSHVLFHYLLILPLNLKFIILTPTLNNYAIIINAVFTVALIWWAYKLTSNH